MRYRTIFLEIYLFNILSRLPVKSVMRFICVRKAWHALFTDPNFIDMHLNQTRENNEGYVFIQRKSFGDKFSLHCDETFVKQKELDFPFERSFERLKVEGCCNGLLCLGTPRHKRDIYLWNPATRRFKALPHSNTQSDGFGEMYVAFAFIPQINDYKVVKFLSYGLGIFPQLPARVEIYSLRMNSWKEIQNFMPYEIGTSSTDKILNGVVHWTAEGNGSHRFILSFDMANEVFGQIELPECCRDKSARTMAAWVLKESLCLFAYCPGREYIWVMKEYGAVESWIKLFTFDRRVSLLFNPVSPSLPLGTLKNGEVVLKGDNEELDLYDPIVQQVRDLRVPGVPRSFVVFTYYMESLVSLNEENQDVGQSNLLDEAICKGARLGHQ